MNIKYALALHTIGLAHHLYVGHFSFFELDFTGIKNDKILDIGRFNFRYFTSWNLMIQTMYLTVSIINDLFIIYGTHFSPKLYRKFATIRGYLFTTFVFPCTMMVFSLFWLLFSIEREWVLPLEADKVLPGWVNHGIHTNILGLLVVELLMPYTTTPSVKKSVIGLFVLNAAYLACYFGTYYQTGRWLYGIYDVMSWPQRIIFANLNFVIILCFLRIGIFVQSLASNFVGFKNTKYYKTILRSNAKKTM